MNARIMDCSGPLPNLFILGAAKCGTTSLYQYLKCHPDIYLSPVKEPCFFCENFQIVKDPVSYARLFESAGDAPFIGEASHVYFTNPASASALHAFFPEAKFILILRHPADRAYSLYHHMRHYGYETISTFEKALVAEEKRAGSEFFRKHCNQYIYNFFYFRSGCFGEQIERYFAYFPKKQFHILTLSQLRKTPGSSIQGILDFLGASIPYPPEAKVFNKGQTSRWPLLQNFINLKLRRPLWLRRIMMTFSKKYNIREIPPMDPGTREYLSQRYAADLKKLHNLTGIKFHE